MPPSLKVSIGPNVDELREISYNDDSSHPVQSQLFDGVVSVHIKGDFGDVSNNKSTYFDDEYRATRTWSIAVQGRFLQEINGDDILFGNVFDRPLNLPFGFSAALNLAQYMDPTLEHNLYDREQPWALSPLLSTMPYFQRIELDPAVPVPTEMSVIKVEQSRPPLALDLESESTPASRRTYFSDPANRRKVHFTPRDLIQADFVHGYLQFPSLTVSLPGGLNFDLMFYYDERPVHFVCKKRGTDETYFVVSFTVIKDGNIQSQGGSSDITPVDSSDID